MDSVRDFGATGDGTHDDTAAFEALVATKSWQPVYAPAGTYRLTRPLRMTSNGRLMGDGPGLTWLAWDSGDGIVFTASDDDNEILHVNDLTFRTKASGGTALKADFSAQIDPGNGHSLGRANARFLVQNCVFQPGGDISATGWDVGLEVVAGLIGQVRDCNFVGRLGGQLAGWPMPAQDTIGCWFHGVGDEGPMNGRPVQFVIDGCTFGLLDQGVAFIGCEGGFVTHCNLVAVGTGVQWESRWVQRPQLNVNNTHINAHRYGIAAYDCADMQISQALIYNYSEGSPPSAGIFCGGELGCLAANITGNTFCGTQQKMNAILVAKGDNGLICNNLFRGNIDTAIWLQAEVTGCRGQENLLVTPPAIHAVFDQGIGNAVRVLPAAQRMRRAAVQEPAPTARILPLSR
jgi:hypothetical protein